MLEPAQADQAEQHQEQEDAFQAGLVELARMARYLVRIHVRGKDHGPRHGGRVGGAAEQFAVDEVRQAAEEYADRRGATHDIGQVQEIYLLLAGEKEHRQQHAEQAAMEGHAAFPDRQDFQRVA